MNTLPVLFRKLQNGEVIALFPTLPGKASPRSMVAYTRFAKRTEAEASIMYVTSEADATEREELAMEVSRAFSNDQLVIRKRITEDLHELRTRARGTEATILAAADVHAA